MKNLKVSLLAFYDSDGNILLNHRSLTEDIWDIIGGGIEENEGPLDAIKREIIEELNYEVNEEKDDLVFDRKFEIVNVDFVAEVYFFKAKFPGFHNFSNSEEINVSDLKFFLVEEALSLKLLPICREILQTIK